MTKDTLALTLAVQDELVQRAEEAQRLRHLQVERAQYEADLAQRRYLKVDPDNRLVESRVRSRMEYEAARIGRSTSHRRAIQAERSTRQPVHRNALRLVGSQNASANSGMIPKPPHASANEQYG